MFETEALSLRKRQVHEYFRLPKNSFTKSVFTKFRKLRKIHKIVTISGGKQAGPVILNKSA